jgi:hypothetical protein
LTYLQLFELERRHCLFFAQTANNAVQVAIERQKQLSLCREKLGLSLKPSKFFSKFCEGM